MEEEKEEACGGERRDLEEGERVCEGEKKRSGRGTQQDEMEWSSQIPHCKVRWSGPTRS